MEKIDRYLGSLQGLAVGDALGTTLEFAEPGTFTPITDMVGGGPFSLRPGEWTDDTSMALCLAESLVEKNSFDPRDQMERYLRWWKEGHLSHSGNCFDIGNTTRKALSQFEITQDPFSGSSDSFAAGNGSIMRLAPVPMFYSREPELAIMKSAESSRTTHGANEAIDACKYLGAIIAGALNGATKDELLSEHYCPIDDYWKNNPLVPKIDDIAMGSFKRKDPPDIRGTGYVVQSLEAALWAFNKGNTFEEGCLLAVNLGDDADTTGAIYGQIAGAYFGEQGIPQKWLTNLAMRPIILDLAHRLFDSSISRP
jgi:ADP-ribosylglycohydrolase